MYDPIKCPECLTLYTLLSVPTTDQPSRDSDLLSLTVIVVP